jgi:hypothetical protein
VTDNAGLPPADWTIAKDETARIYAAAGVRIVWAERRGEQEQVENALNLTVLILSPEMAEGKASSSGASNRVLGQAVQPAGRAYIFAHRIARIAANYKRAAGIVLGTVIAHEVGHLVLPVHSHSKTGIMCADLDLSVPSTAGFTTEQVETIHAMLASN